MKTYRLLLVGSADNIVYGIKEYDADSDATAARLADQLCGEYPDDLWWQGQELRRELKRA